MSPTFQWMTFDSGAATKPTYLGPFLRIVWIRAAERMSRIFFMSSIYWRSLDCNSPSTWHNRGGLPHRKSSYTLLGLVSLSRSWRTIGDKPLGALVRGDSLQLPAFA